jgi:hypothetical protein
VRKSRSRRSISGRRSKPSGCLSLGIVYDPKDDIIEIALENLDHMIRKPREVFVDQGELGLTSLKATDGDGRQHIVQLREPLMLPQPA